MEKLLKLVATLIFAFLILWGCKKEDPVPEPEVIPEATDVNKFIFNGLATYYLWEDKIPAFQEPKYENKDSLNKFLNKYKDPEALFNSLLYNKGVVDKFSLIFDNSKEVDDWLAGISESVGMDFKLYYIRSGSTDLVGIVRYVFKNSPAAKAGIKRGDIFLTIDGQQLTYTNYQTLLFTKKTYTMGMASFNGAIFSLNGKNITMTAVRLLENPVHLDTILNVNGIKVGYLVYNAFTNTYDSTLNTSHDIILNNAFGKFINGGITKLIVDLRYNGGGSITTTGYLASMIYSTNSQLIFAKTFYNKYLYDYYKGAYGASYFNDYFKTDIAKTSQTPLTKINSLGLNEVYFITTSETASAPELLINGLKPYLSVKQVGSNTYGKNVGSVTIKDWIDNNGTVNPKHTWAMQPIILKISNSQDFGEYENGLAPNINAQEYPSDLRPFGDPNEDLLKACLDNIKGGKSARIYTGPELKPFKSSDEISPFSKTMFIDNKPLQQLHRP